MFVEIENSPLRYAWGERGALSLYLGNSGVLVDPEAESGDTPIQAEVWLGAHDGSPSRVVDPELTGGAVTLADWIAERPEQALGRFANGLREGDTPRLPFLLKVLAAGKPLSLQVHPSLAEARAGFAAENAQGIPVAAPNRNYRDGFHKPELLVALSPELSALAGFRDFDEVKELVASVRDAAADAGIDGDFAPFAEQVEALQPGHELHDLVEWVLAATPEAHAAAKAVDVWLAADSDDFPIERRHLQLVRDAFPDDAGALTVLLMNHLVLREGEALHVPSGTLHAYLKGVGVEVMAASDNVLRGGLTQKHVDPAELLRVLNCTPIASPRLEPQQNQEGDKVFRGVDPDFALRRLTETSAEVLLPGPVIALNLSGRATMTGDSGATVTLDQGDAVYVTEDEARLRIVADDLVLASTAVCQGTPLPLPRE